MSNDNFVNAINIVCALDAERRRLVEENTQLINGTARQAATIRTLHERISKLETEVNLAQYSVEFLKVQGRKTRSKMKALRKQIASAERETVKIYDYFF